MGSLTVTATGKSTLLWGFPVSLKLEKPADVATVADVKAALAAKFPRV
jgi:very-long-chain enoyl-CoA reductase